MEPVSGLTRALLLRSLWLVFWIPSVAISPWQDFNSKHELLNSAVLEYLDSGPAICAGMDTSRPGLNPFIETFYSPSRPRGRPSCLCPHHKGAGPCITWRYNLKECLVRVQVGNDIASHGDLDSVGRQFEPYRWSTSSCLGFRSRTAWVVSCCEPPPFKLCQSRWLRASLLCDSKPISSRI